MTQPLSTARYTDDPHQSPTESVEDYAIYALDARGHLCSWNAGAERIEGYSADEILGRHFSIFYPEEDIRSGKPARELDVAARAGRFENEGWRLRKDGSRFWANVVITASREEEGKLVGFAKITRDLTARRALEAQLRQARKMEAVGQLAGGMAHDFNNLLTVITSYSGLLLAELPEDSPLRADVEQISGAASRAATLTRQLLAFSRE